MVTLASPWVLLALPLPFFIRRVMRAAKLRTHAGLIIPHFQQLSSIPALRRSLPSKLPWWLILTWLLLILAASGPCTLSAPIAPIQPGHNIMLALDVSGSMGLNDMQWNHRRASRLHVVKQAAIQFVSARNNDKLGLILFGTRAYLLTPLTADKHTVLQRLEEASVGLAGNSTALGDPIGLAVKHLQHTPKTGRIIILLTDGANNSGVLSLEKATALANDEGIKIYTIGLGAQPPQLLSQDAFFPPNHGMDLDEKALKKMATATGGRYFLATDQTSLQQIYALINQIETTPQAQLPLRPRTDYYFWPLSLALVLLWAGLFYEKYVTC